MGGMGLIFTPVLVRHLLLLGHPGLSRSMTVSLQCRWHCLYIKMEYNKMDRSRISLYLQ